MASTKRRKIDPNEEVKKYLRLELSNLLLERRRSLSDEDLRLLRMLRESEPFQFILNPTTSQDGLGSLVVNASDELQGFFGDQSQLDSVLIVQTLINYLPNTMCILKIHTITFKDKKATNHT